MDAFEYHALSKETVKETLIGKLTISQSIWILIGGFLSMKMAEIVPKLPFRLILAYIHYLIPLCICSFFAFVNHQSGLTFLQYYFSNRQYKKRKKKAYIDH